MVYTIKVCNVLMKWPKDKLQSQGHIHKHYRGQFATFYVVDSTCIAIVRLFIHVSQALQGKDNIYM